MTRSLIKLCSKNIALHFHLVTDPSSWEIAKEIIHNESKKTQINIQVRPYVNFVVEVFLMLVFHFRYQPIL
jgi:hypothetical protein